MKGLMLKDFYTMIRQLKFFIIILIIFACMPGGLSGYAIFYAAMLPITALAYDERSKWGQMAAMMPYSKRSLVLSKYLLGYILTLCAAVVALIARLVLGPLTGNPFGPAQVQEVVMLLFVAEIMLAVILPVMFRFGVEKGRLALFVVAALIVIGGIGVKENLAGNLGGGVDLTGGPVLSVTAGLAIVFNLISIPLSRKMYDAKMTKRGRTSSF